MSDVRIPGVDVTLSGVTYILPALPLIKVATVKDFLNCGGDFINNPDAVKLFVDALFYSLKRNYPDITPDVIENSLDLLTVNAILAAFMQANGFVAKKVDTTEASPSGEATAS